MSNTTPVFDVLSSPIGNLTLTADSHGYLTNILLPASADAPSLAKLGRRDQALFAELRTQLADYFLGRLRTFSFVLPSAIGTSFQRLVWQELTRIPFGQTISYAELARRVGNPKAVRAVGGANRRNPFPIVVPCHRVIGKSGDLVGFGGGLDAKRWLLRHEQHVLGTTPPTQVAASQPELPYQPVGGSTTIRA